MTTVKITYHLISEPDVVIVKKFRDPMRATAFVERSVGAACLAGYKPDKFGSAYFGVTLRCMVNLIVGGWTERTIHIDRINP